MIGMKRQRGVALITAVLIVALAAILAVNVGFKGYLDQRRSMTMFALDQGFQVGLGAEAWAADILMSDYKGSPTHEINLSQKWATPIPPLPIDGGDVEGHLEDLQGRFNLNDLADSNPVTQKATVAQFARILEMATLEPEWTGKIIDWIDADTVPTSPDGAEDDVYSAQTPPYRAANMQITRTSELLALPGFGPDRYRKLEPLVTALPAHSGINLCTAPAIVLDSFSAANRQFSLDPQSLPKQRTRGCFPTPEQFKNQLSADEQQHLGYMQAQVTSSYFRATIWVTIGTTQFTLYSLLQRTQTGVRSVARSFGTT